MATLREIDGAYVLDWRDHEGKRHRDTLGKIGEFPKREAERLLKQRNLELSAGYRVLNPGAAPAFGQFIADYLAWHDAEYPSSHYRVEQIVNDHLLPEFEFLPLDGITKIHVEKWKHRRLAAADDDGKTPKGATVTKELRTLRAIINKAVEWEQIARNPIASVKAPASLDSKPPAFYTAAELLLLYAACRAMVNNGEGPQPNPMRAHVWKLYANTGMRRMEGLMLRRSWIGRDAMKILSSEDARTKSGKWRHIPLTEGAMIALDALPKDGQYVVPRMTPASLSRACLKDIARAGLDGSLHTLRHTYISHMVMAGVPIRTVQKLAGHSSVAVTEKYSHLAPDYLQKAGRSISL